MLVAYLQRHIFVLYFTNCNCALQGNYTQVDFREKETLLQYLDFFDDK
jgi:hypothetical protein